MSLTSESGDIPSDIASDIPPDTPLEISTTSGSDDCRARATARPPSKARRPQSKVAHELRQMQNRVEFDRDGHQSLGAAPVFLGLMQVAGEFECNRNLRG